MQRYRSEVFFVVTVPAFAIVSAALGANLGFKTVVVMGLANLIADAISMGLGDALSEKQRRPSLTTP